MGNGTSAPLLVNPLKTYYGAASLEIFALGRCGRHPLKALRS